MAWRAKRGLSAVHSAVQQNGSEQERDALTRTGGVRRPRPTSNLAIGTAAVATFGNAGGAARRGAGEPSSELLVPGSELDGEAPGGPIGLGSANGRKRKITRKRKIGPNRGRRRGIRESVTRFRWGKGQRARGCGVRDEMVPRASAQLPALPRDRPRWSALPHASDHGACGAEP